MSLLRVLLRTESGGAAVLLAATAAALVGVNVDASCSEAAADEGALWEMHDQTLERQDRLQMPDLCRTPTDSDSTSRASPRNCGARRGDRIAKSVEGGDLSGYPARPRSSSTG